MREGQGQYVQMLVSQDSENLVKEVDVTIEAVSQLIKATEMGR